MNEVELVQTGKAREDLLGDATENRLGNRAMANEIAESAGVHELEGDVDGAIHKKGIVELDNVRRADAVQSLQFQ